MTDKSQSTPCSICNGSAPANPQGGLILVKCDVCGRVAWLSVDADEGD